MVEDAGLRNIAAHCLNAFLISLVLSLVMEKLARRFGFVDVPTVRKKHEGSIPLVGLAVFLAFSASSLLVGERPPGVVGFFVGLTMIVLIGLVDDKMDLRAPYKLLAQVVSVAAIASSGDLLIVSAGNLDHGQPLMLGEWAVPMTIFAVVGMINAINMIDGLDGLAGGISSASLIWFAAAAQLLGRSDVLLVILVLACSVLGFLVLNLRYPWRLRAAVFLGDSGSMMLGLALAFIAASLSQHPKLALSPIAVLWICGLPIIDTVSLIVRRLAAGHNPMASDRQHLHYLMLDSGFSVGQTVTLLIGINMVLGAIGVVGWYLEVPDRILLLGLMVPISLHAWFIGYVWRHQPGAAQLSHGKAARSGLPEKRHQL
jgi:UDP-GlcNAc:undecaprenyl-phosphate/decaprenyl-phosphate GlcNAc-1-phosphate transferase